LLDFPQFNELLMESGLEDGLSNSNMVGKQGGLPVDETETFKEF